MQKLSVALTKKLTKRLQKGMALFYLLELFIAQRYYIRTEIYNIILVQCTCTGLWVLHLYIICKNVQLST